MNVETGTEAARFLEKKYINGIIVAVCCNGTIQGPAILIGGRDYCTGSRLEWLYFLKSCF